MKRDATIIKGRHIFFFYVSVFSIFIYVCIRRNMLHMNNNNCSFSLYTKKKKKHIFDVEIS